MFTPVELTSQERDAWMKVRTVLAWNTPSFSHIFYSMLNNANSEHIALFTEGVPVAATDGANLIINPRTFFKYKLMEHVFVVAHEILECVFQHPRLYAGFAKAGFVKYADGAKLPFDHMTMNMAGDYHINDILVTSGVGKFNPDWLHDRSLGTKDESVVDIYRKLYNRQKNREAGGGGGGQDGSGKPFDQVLPPGVTSQSKQGVEQAQGQAKHKWEAAIASAAHLAREQAKNANRNQGLMALGLARTLDKINEPVVTWEDKFHAFFTRKVGSGSYDWRHPDRRFITRDIYVPRRATFQAGDIVVACDTSGSMSETEISMCFAEIAGILEQINPRRLFVLWCDAYVHRVDELEGIDDLYTAKKKGAPGGGGTNFVPVFEWIKENCWNQPDALVFFTDGYGTFPSEKPHYPVFWGNITPKREYPFGDVIDIPMGHRY
jgi:predicted metal-dependent peptidase